MLNKRTIGVLTGGGDCPGLNAVIRAVVRSALREGWRVYGVENGFAGLVEDQMQLLDEFSVSGILPRGGTILGTTNRDNPFHYAVLENETVVYKDMSDKAVSNLRRHNIETLVVIGGDGSLRIAEKLSAKDVNIVGVPKTIDNDIPSTERTFGFDTAMSIATEALDRLHTTAESHHRVMLLEVMGRNSGWIALHAGIGGGAHCIVIPEIPYKVESLINKIEARRKTGRTYSLIIIAEGAKPLGGDVTISRMVEGSFEAVRLGGVGQKLAQEIEDITKIESRCTVLGHLQRGGTPTPFDRVLCTRYGAAAFRACIEEKFGTMVALQKDEIITVPLDSVADKPNDVSPTSELVKVAKSIGVSFGD
jgi:6-phosphofructokinase 1